jgi:hypothetical protein
MVSVLQMCFKLRGFHLIGLMVIALSLGWVIRGWRHGFGYGYDTHVHVHEIHPHPNVHATPPSPSPSVMLGSRKFSKGPSLYISNDGDHIIPTTISPTPPAKLAEPPKGSPLPSNASHSSSSSLLSPAAPSPASPSTGAGGRPEPHILTTTPSVLTPSKGPSLSISNNGDHNHTSTTSPTSSTKIPKPTLPNDSKTSPKTAIKRLQTVIESLQPPPRQPQLQTQPPLLPQQQQKQQQPSKASLPSVDRSSPYRWSVIPQGWYDDEEYDDNIDGITCTTEIPLRRDGHLRNKETISILSHLGVNITTNEKTKGKGNAKTKAQPNPKPKPWWYRRLVEDSDCQHLTSMKQCHQTSLTCQWSLQGYCFNYSAPSIGKPTATHPRDMDTYTLHTNVI